MNKRILPLIFAILAFATNASAQVPNVQVYFEGDPSTSSFWKTAQNCKSFGTEQNLYVVYLNFNMYLWAVEFSIDYPRALFRADDVYPTDALTIGTSDANNGQGGMSIAWFNPQNAFVPFLALRVHAYWTSNCACGGPGGGFQYLVVRGNQYIGTGHQNPRAVRWPDFAEIDGVGMTSVVCGEEDPLATQQTTWGAVKALYR